MRVFAVKCVDKTGHTMVAEECSYNIAMDWLQRVQRRVGRDIFRLDHEDSYNTTIYTGLPVDGYDMNGKPERFYTNIEKYYYDEFRGYLMSD